MEYSLSMIFLTETGERQAFCINGVDPDLIEEESVKELMEAIVASQAYHSKKGLLETPVKATLTGRKATKFDFRA